MSEKIPQDNQNEVIEKGEWLCFKISDETYAHDALLVDEVLRYSEPTPVPGSPHGILGLLNIRGSVVSVFSGRALIGLTDEPPTDESRIVIFKTENESIGVVVDSVVEIAYFSKNQVEGAVAQHQDRAFIKGTIHHQKQLLIVVDFSNIDK
ncbi:chemotaxis protein CheW [Pleionea sp. CnH1-48]|uniref:chemotaxis protein CheW n=1 Tax=Pleionea sp. CnH1-48 TaxID=2954494 RepID=UPI0020975DDD|nr:chemotaxis protein CheW [Pleionea sp. CnH1-48]MCO7224383.1 chemotaxis protein CheW [Pleionea sp. CnH1-48]